jgi:hypothetical protein
MGHLKGDDTGRLAEDRAKFDAKRLGAFNPPDKDEVAQFIANLEGDRKLKIQPEARQNYEALLADLKKVNDALTTQNKQLLADKAKAEALKKNAEDELAKEIQKNKDELAKLQKDVNAKLDDYLKSFEARIAQLDEENKKTVARIGTGDADKRTVEQQLATEKAKSNAYKAQLAIKDIQITRLQKDLGHDAPTSINMDRRIVSIDQSGTTAYINLGSGDKLASGLTFRVHGIGEDGKAKPRDKASVEVLKVVEDHLSQVRVYYDYDEKLEPRPQRHSPRRDPVLKGDVIYNPTWDPYEKKHIAIAGAIDLVGDGRNSLPEFIRSLERQNVVVDAYLDTDDMEIKGPGISVNTDLLILGPLPRALQNPRGPDAAVKQKMLEGVAKLKKDAEDNGVKRRGLRQYLEEIGYRVPKGLGDEGAEYVKSKEIEAPTPKPDKPMPPEKPMPPDMPPKLP